MLQEWLLCGIHQHDQLVGDVTGDITNNVVERIRNINVAADTPAEGQVLTYNDADRQWQAREIPNPGITLGGDVSGPVDNVKIIHLQNAPVSDTAQVPQPGQVLTVQPGGEWQAANPIGTMSNAIEHPVGLPLYMIVAAGMVRGDGSSIGPVYNKLMAGATKDGELTVTFSGYRQPEPHFQYIVKVLPVFDIEMLNLPAVSFMRFEPDAFVLYVANRGNKVRQDILAQQTFMIEVSQFFMEH
jgi:hypothetical protein